MPDYTLSAKITGDSSGFDKAIQSAEKTASSFEKRMESISSKAKSIGDKLSGIGTALTVGVTTPLAVAGKSAANTAAEFESSMSRTQGALNLTSAEMEELKDLAMEMGAQTIFSAADAGDAMNELAKGGLTAADIQAGALKSTMDLAASSGMDMATSANTIVKAMGGFQLSASETGDAVNALAGAASASAADVSDISEALAQCSASANNAGWSIQDTTAVLGAFADAGIVGSDAGTSLKTMLQSLSAPTDKARELMSQLGINIYDSNGHMLDAAGVAQELQTSLAGLGDQQRAQALDTIFGSDATRAATILMNQGAEGIAKYTKATNDQTAASRLANAQLGPLQKSIENMKGSIETASIAIGETMAPYIQKAAEFVGSLANKFAEASPTVQKFVLIAAAIAAALGPVLIVLGTLTSSIGSISSTVGLLGGKIAALGGMKAALSGVFTAITGPVGIAVAAITALVAAFAYLMTTNDGFRNSIVNTATSVGGTFQAAINTVLPVLQQLASVIGTTITTALNAIAPIISQIVALIGQVMAQIAPLMAQIISQLVPIISQIVQFIGQIIAQVAPLISQLVGQLAPVLQSIMGTISQLVSSLLPPITSILQAIMGAVEAIMPPVMSVLSTVIDVVSGIISAISPIVSTVGDIISGVMSVISPIISFVADIISGIVDVISPIISFIGNIVSKIISAISPIASTVSSVFQKIFSVISSIMNKVGSVMTKVFGAIKSAWNGLTGFVSGVFDGIASAFDSLVSGVKSVINGVIGGINSAIGIINKIPGVEIGKIPKLAHGTDNWAGGFAVMNEGGRGELTYLPNGAQVIPHDLSVKYAKEAARTNQTAESIDMEALGGYIISAMIEYGNRQGQAIEKGISNMGIYFERRPFGRVIADMGFQKG